MPLRDDKPYFVDATRGRCRFEHALVVNRKDGSILVRVPGGEFHMGDGKDGARPRQTVHVEHFWIGVYCVTNGQYRRFLEETKHREPTSPECRREGQEAHPVTGVSWEDAAAYAQWAGCELPTEAQWEKAARGLQGSIYPWGDDWDRNRCRHISNMWGESSAVVWAYPDGVSGYGTYQQSGNVWEWCRDYYDQDFHRRMPPGLDNIRVLRGGAALGGKPWGFRCSFRLPGESCVRHEASGFRIVRNGQSYPQAMLKDVTLKIVRQRRHLLPQLFEKQSPGDDADAVRPIWLAAAIDDRERNAGVVLAERPQAREVIAAECLDRVISGLLEEPGKLARGNQKGL